MGPIVQHSGRWGHLQLSGRRWIILNMPPYNQHRIIHDLQTAGLPDMNWAMLELPAYRGKNTPEAWVSPDQQRWASSCKPMFQCSGWPGSAHHEILWYFSSLFASTHLVLPDISWCCTASRNHLSLTFSDKPQAQHQQWSKNNALDVPGSLIEDRV